MIFVDTNVVMYAVGRAHPLREPAQDFLAELVKTPARFFTSAEVLQELMHAYLPVDRLATLDAAFELLERLPIEVFGIEKETIFYARGLVAEHPGLSARDLIHLAVCLELGVDGIKTYDRSLVAACEQAGLKTL